MFCTQCGSNVPDEAQFCGECGLPTDEAAHTSEILEGDSSTPDPIDVEDKTVSVEVDDTLVSDQQTNSDSEPSPKKKKRTPLIITGACVIVLALAGVLGITFISSTPSSAIAVIELNEEAIPDEGFRTLLAQLYDLDGDGKLDRTELAAIRSLNLNDESEGLFERTTGSTTTQIIKIGEGSRSSEVNGSTDQEINSAFSSTSTIDLTPFPNLESFTFTNGGLEELIISDNISLANLNVSGNNLTTLDLPSSSELTYLDVEGNNLETLDLGVAKDLTYANLTNNKLTELDLKNNKELEALYCDDGVVIDGLDKTGLAVRSLITSAEYSYSSMGDSSMKVRYDDRGRPVSAIHDYGETNTQQDIRYYYDNDLDKLASVQTFFIHGTEKSYTYDSKGLVTDAVLNYNNGSRSLSIKYDQEDNPSEVTRSTSSDTPLDNTSYDYSNSYIYDSSNKLIKIQGEGNYYTNMDTSSEELEFIYSENDQLLEITTLTNTNSILAYGDQGLCSEIASTNEANGFYENTSYDDQGLPVETEIEGTDMTIAYECNSLGYITKASWTANSSIYKELNREVNIEYVLCVLPEEIAYSASIPSFEFMSYGTYTNVIPEGTDLFYEQGNGNYYGASIAMFMPEHSAFRDLEASVSTLESPIKREEQKERWAGKGTGALEVASISYSDENTSEQSIIANDLQEAMISDTLMLWKTGSDGTYYQLEIEKGVWVLYSGKKPSSGMKQELNDLTAVASGITDGEYFYEKGNAEYRAYYTSTKITLELELKATDNTEDVVGSFYLSFDEGIR